MRLSDLFDIQRLQELCDSFTALTGAVTAILDLEGNVFVATGWRDICTRFHRAHPTTAARCRESDTVLSDPQGDGRPYKLYRCHNGLVDVAMPIVVGGEHVGNFFTGQFFLESPDREHFNRQAATFGFDPGAYMAALEAVPVFTKAQLDAMMDFFARLTRLFADVGLKQKRLQEMIELHQKSEERFSLAMDATRDGLWDWNIETGEVYYSPGYTAMLGYDGSDLSSHVSAWQDLIHPEDRARAEQTNVDCIENRIAHFETEFRMQHKDGQWRWILGRGSAVSRGPDGRARRMIGTHTDITDRKAAERRVRQSEERLSRAFAKAPVIMGISRLEDGTYLEINEKFCEVTGYTRDEVIGRSSIELGLLTADARRRLVDELRSNGLFSHLEVQLVAKGGRLLTVVMSGQVLEFEGHARLLASAVDVTEQKRLEAELRQSQKMESIGRLAGGIAHDFNNKLMVVLGHADLAARAFPGLEMLQEHLQEILRAAQSSREIIQQLLAFSRRQVISPRPIDVNDCIERSRKSLALLIGEDVRLSFTPSERPWTVLMDPVQLDQTIMNLAVNARDAMTGGGWISITTDNVEIDAAQASLSKDARPGQYLRITVTDNGRGMDSDTLRHVFEPFYTTKEDGKGTGLGLATVYGIVTQNRGFIDVTSEAGRGTRFRIHLPRHGSAQPAEPPRPACSPTGSGTVLLVEDEDGVRRLTAGMLSRIGYKVIESASPDDALRIAEQQPRDIDLVLTDLVMPSMTGRELGRRLASILPDVPTVLMTGYTMLRAQGPGREKELLLHKPFTLEALAEILKKARDGQAAQGSSSDETVSSRR